MARKANNSQKQKILSLQKDVEFGTEYVPDFILPCPKCEKRVIDVSGRPERTILVRYKCPHCSSTVIAPIFATKNSEQRAPHYK